MSAAQPVPVTQRFGAGARRLIGRRIEVARRLARGESAADIARDMGISRQRVGQIVSPVRSKAREKIGKAVAQGDIQRPAQCGDCGRRRRVAAHHDDYSAPLQVRWLCSPCHAKADRAISRAERRRQIAEELIGNGRELIEAGEQLLRRAAA